ncbi:MAG: DNA-3-methyladenine glycosylase I [Chloroflexi bacterium]|nr:DNA-3-methyladenine glycosylase I [Chloroflexota bacterium]
MPDMEAPDRTTPQNPGDYLEIMSKVVFQSGMSYKIVESKWPGTREAFHDFNADRVARMTPSEIDQLTEDTRVIRNRRKLEAVVANAHRILELEAEFGGFQKYLRSHGDFVSLVKDLRDQFKFLGEMGCYYYLYVVGEEVPDHEKWQASLKKR